MNAEQPPIFSAPDLPRHVLGEIVRDKVIVEHRTILIERPEESDRLLDQPAVRSAFAVDEYLPYWADLWPASRMLAKVILREDWQPGLEALEIGCGLGLPGIAALMQGMRVIFSDYDPNALRFAAANARLNGHEDFRLLQLDWRQPPDNLRVPVLFASDLVYELRNVEPLVNFIRRVLAPGGTCLLTDQNRVPSHVMREALPQAGLAFIAQLVRAGEPGGQRYKGTLYRIKHAGD